MCLLLPFTVSDRSSGFLLLEKALSVKVMIIKEMKEYGKLCQRLAKLNVRILFDSRFGQGCQLF